MSVNGFLNVCTGKFAPDPGGRFELTSDLFPRKMTEVQPTLYGTTNGKADTSGATYVRQASRWVPVTPNQVSPDGTRYAYVATVIRPGATTQGYDAIDHAEVRVVDIVSGIERAVYTVRSFDDPGIILRFAREGIYLTKGCPSGCLTDSGQLWLLNPDSGTVMKSPQLAVSPDDYVGSWQFAEGTAWTIVLGHAEARLIRLDLVTGDQAIWAEWNLAKLPVPESARLALDNRGLPLVVERGGDMLKPSYWLVRFIASHSEERVADLSSGFANTSFVTEPAGTWYWARNGFFLYAPPAAPRLVATVTDYAYVAAGRLGQ